MNRDFSKKGLETKMRKQLSQLPPYLLEGENKLNDCGVLPPRLNPPFLPLHFQLKKRNGGYMNHYLFPPTYWGYSTYPNKKPKESGYYKVVLNNHSELIEALDYYDVDKKEWSWYNKSTLATNIDCYSDRRLPIVMFDPTSLITINLPPLEDLKL